jgi:hypothetical protein
VVKDTQRPAVAGERCTCGRLAVFVFVTDEWGAVGWCGWSDGGRRGPCVFFGAAGGHPEGRCPAYRLRPDVEKAHQADPHIGAAEKAGAQ